MDKVVNLKEFRDATADKREKDRNRFPGIIASLKAVSLEWKDRRLVIEYRAEDESLCLAIKANPAWALELFGIVRAIRTFSLSANIVMPDNVSILEKKINRLAIRVIRVTYRTVESIKYETHIPEQTLALDNGRIEHVIPAPNKGV